MTTNSYGFITLCVLILGMASSLWADDTDRLIIESANWAKPVFDIQKDKHIDLTFRTNIDCRYQVIIRDRSGQYKVYESPWTEILTAGWQRFSWDGNDQAGNVVPSGVYLFQILGETPLRKGQVIHDVSITSHHKMQPIRNIKLEKDEEGGFTIRYGLPSISLVRVMVFLDGPDTPLIKTLVNWEVQLSGDQQLTWDGLDESGNYKVDDPKSITMRGQYYEFTDNALWVRSANNQDIFPDYWERKYDTDANRANFLDHWAQPAYLSGNGVLTLQGSPGEDVDGRHIVDKELTITVQLQEKDRLHFQRERYEVALYLDGRYLHEEEMGYLPFHYRLLPDELTPGEHYLYAMLFGYHGNLAAGSIKLFQPEREEPTDEGQKP